MFLLSFLCLSFSMAMSYIFSAVGIFLAIISIVKTRNKSFSIEKTAYFLIIILPFIFTIISTLYTENSNLYRIEKLIFFVLTVFAILFLENRNSLSNNKILLYFAYSTIAIYVISIISGLFYYSKTGFFFEYKYANDFLNIQHNYLSIYGVFSCYILLVDMFKKNKKKRYLLNTFFILLIIGFIILISSRFAIILLIFLFFIFSFLNIKNKIYTLISILFAGIIFLILFFSTNTLERFEKLMVEDRSPRYSIWRCSIKIINDEVSFLKGLGPSNVQEKIDECLIENGRKYWVGLHSHNQIMGYILAFGYLPTFIIIFVFLHFLYLALKFRNYDFLIFLIIIITFGFTENYMMRRYGIFFYGFFISLFVKNIKTLS